MDDRIETVAREYIANKVRLLNRAVTAVYDEALRPHGLKISQMSVLVTVARMDGASPGAVGRTLHMEKSTLSRNVDRMRARGWLEAVQGGQDLGAHVNVAAGKAFRFTYGPDTGAIRRAHEKLDFPYDSITEVRRVTGVDLRPSTPAERC